MRSVFLVICLFSLFIFSCKDGKKDNVTSDLIEIPGSASSSSKKEHMPVMAFEKDVHDFGRLTEGERISYSFKFSNTGNADMVITQVEPGCGCTVADYPKNIIKPGESGYITLTFNSSGKRGQQNQVVSIIANTQPSVNHVTIRAQVVSIN